MYNTRQKFLKLYEAFSAVDPTPKSTVSHRIFGRVTKLQDVIDGADMLTGSYDKARQYFSENWPAGIDRPEALKSDEVA